MTTAQVVETSVTVNNSPIQDYVHPDDQTQFTYDSWVPTFHNNSNLVQQIKNLKSEMPTKARSKLFN